MPLRDRNRFIPETVTLNVMPRAGVLHGNIVSVRCTHPQSRVGGPVGGLVRRAAAEPCERNSTASAAWVDLGGTDGLCGHVLFSH